MTNSKTEEHAAGCAPLTDLHSHLLPGIDDGARDTEESARLLKLEYESGVRQIALTAHFDCEKVSVSDFLARREASYCRMREALADGGRAYSDLTLKTGAEVFFSPNLRPEKLEELCIQDTSFMLLELPTDMPPAWFNETVCMLLSYGITPVIAHVERYSYVMNDLPILCDWIDRGMYIQVNAGAILKGGARAKLCLKLIEWNMCHVIASDAHSAETRPPNLRKGLDAVSDRLGRDAAVRLICNADDIFGGREPEGKEMHYPRKMMGRWR